METGNGNSDLLPLWDARVKKCREYLEKHSTIEMAILAAEKDLFFASNVAWISALLSVGRDLNGNSYKSPAGQQRPGHQKYLSLQFLILDLCTRFNNRFCQVRKLTSSNHSAEVDIQKLGSGLILSSSKQTLPALWPEVLQFGAPRFPAIGTITPNEAPLLINSKNVPLRGRAHDFPSRHLPWV